MMENKAANNTKAREIAEKLAALLKSTAVPHHTNSKYSGEYRVETRCGGITVIGDSRTGIRCNVNCDFNNAFGDDFHSKWFSLTTPEGEFNTFAIENLYATIPKMVQLRVSGKL